MNEELSQLAAKKSLTQADRDTLETLSGLRHLGIEVPIIVDTQDINVNTLILCAPAITPPLEVVPAVVAARSISVESSLAQPLAQADVAPRVRKSPVVSAPSSPLSSVPSEEVTEDEEEVIISAKPSSIQPELFPSGRPLATATLTPESINFPCKIIPEAHSILFFGKL